MRRHFAFLGWFCLAFGCTAGHEPRTEVVVVLDAESAVRAGAAHVRVTVSAGTGATLTQRLDQTLGDTMTPLRWPNSVALVPLGGDAGRAFNLRADALDASGGVISTVRLLSGFRAQHTLTITLLFEDCCRAMTCNDVQTCRACTCTNAHVDPTMIPDIDASIPDAGMDAGRDVGVDATSDAGQDVGNDSARGDSGEDVGIDARTDVGVDAGMDAGTDAGVDAGSPAPPCWVPMPGTGSPPPAETTGPIAGVWTGSEMLVWGGYSSVTTMSVGTGGLVASGALGPWTTIPTAGAPAGRQVYAFAWTGSEFLVWGGYGRPGGFLGDFHGFTPSTGNWRAISTTNGPPPASYGCGAWTGTGFVVWGGGNGSVGVNNGGRWDSTAGWRTTTTSGAPAGRQPNGACLWTGTELVIWGGDGLRSGGLYDPAADTWRAVSTTGAAPPGSSRGAYGWIGGELIAWGGDNNAGALVAADRGGVWSSSSNTWRSITGVGAPSARNEPAYAVVGGLLIVWGGVDLTGAPFGDGAAYDPALDRWYPLTAGGAPAARYAPFATAVPGGMAVWGGRGLAGSLADGATYYQVCP